MNRCANRPVRDLSAALTTLWRHDRGAGRSKSVELVGLDLTAEMYLDPNKIVVWHY